MLKNFIVAKLKENFEHLPTPSQEILMSSLADFIYSQNRDDLFLLKGFAGTGKTSIVNSLVKTLSQFQIKSQLLAPTGRASKVLSAYSERKAFTIHKKIYRQKQSVDAFGSFNLEANLHTNTIFIVDEASMISNETGESNVFGTGRLLDDLIEYVYKGIGCKLMLIGDTAQLPPVGLVVSPALDRLKLQSYRKNIYEVFLTDVVRQSVESGILFNATEIRKLIETENYSGDYPNINISDYKDIERIGGQDLIEKLTDEFAKFGAESCMVINRSNKRANRYNQGIRNSVLYREEEISSGDFLMVVKNNYHYVEENEDIDFIANGDIVELLRIRNYEERYGFRYANVTIRLIDYSDMELDVKLLLDTLSTETPSLSSEENKKLFFSIAEDYEDIPNKKLRFKKVKEDPYFNALQIKFAYAVTCHKAQGGQWRTIFVDQGYIEDTQLPMEYLRWLYTAFTRATSKLYLVNFKDEFFNLPAPK